MLAIQFLDPNDQIRYTFDCLDNDLCHGSSVWIPLLNRQLPIQFSKRVYLIEKKKVGGSI